MSVRFWFPISALRKAGLFAALCGGLVTNTCLAVEPPALRARLVAGQNIKIIADAPASGLRRARLQLQKAAGDGSGFHSIAVVRLSRRREVLFDQAPADGQVRYRSRLLSARGLSRWSNTVRVKVQNLEENAFWEELFEDPDNSEQSTTTTTETTTTTTMTSGGQVGGSGSEVGEQSPLSAPALPSGFAECPAETVAQFLVQVNLRRLQAGGLVSLVPQEHLEVAARAHVIGMGVTQILTHENWLEEILTTGFRSAHVAQNIASFIQDPVVLVNAFMDSPSHRDNILDALSSLTGVSCVVDGNGKFWWAQNFSSARL